MQLVSMADESVRSLTIQSPTTQLQSFSEDSVFEDVSIDFPTSRKLDQIIDNEEDQVRQVCFDLFSVLNYCILRNETK